MGQRAWQLVEPPSILIVDDNTLNSQLLSEIFQRQGYDVRCAESGTMAMCSALSSPPDLILLDVRMPDVDGYEVCRRLKSLEELAAIPVIFVSGLDDAIDKVKAFEAGGVDYVTKPFHTAEVLARAAAHLKVRRLQRELENNNRNLQRLVQEQVASITAGHMATIYALAKLAEYRDDATGKHIQRVQKYCEVLAVRLRNDTSLRHYIDDSYIDHLSQASALHDIGKVGIPDATLLKPGPLNPVEYRIMRTHTTIGARTLEEVLRCYPENRFIKMGVSIARSHHERWDGTGYPQGLAETKIPLSARILTIADQYDALRSARPYKPALDHATACAILVEGDGRTLPSHFDPVVLRAFMDSRRELARVYDSFCAGAVASKTA